MVVPYYLTPLLGALAWSPRHARERLHQSGYRALGGTEYLININSPYGIAWVMALFEGSVAFVMIGAVMKSMDPSLEEASQVIGASRLRTMLRDDAAAGDARRARRRRVRVRRDARLVRRRARARRARPLLRRHDRDLQLMQQYPPKNPVAAAMGISLFVVMFVTLYIYRRIITVGSYVTITGKAFRPRVNDVGRLR